MSAQAPIVVAMSGGVDSSAAALMLHEQGHKVVGVAMQVWDYRKNGGNATKATCCAPADFDDARQVADKAGFPFYVFDFEDSFYDAVITPFVNSYLNGQTPNPCLDCNRKVKFRELRNRARSFGASHVATGHYAQIRKLPDGTFGLFTGADLAKDQSYFLYAMTQKDLAETLFPVGSMEKHEVRGYLEDRKIHLAQKDESQDICFVADSVSDFIEKEASGKGKTGKIIRSNGEVLGEHEGVHRFTVGQRKGLGLDHHNRLFVLQIDSESGEVHVGDKSELARESFYVEQVNWISGVVPEGSITSRVKLRYRHEGVVCNVQPCGDGRAKVTFSEKWTTVSPGQAAVFYSLNEESDGAVCVFGGGIISKDQA